MSAQLPITLTSSEVKRYPKLANLLVRIGEHVTESGASKATVTELDEATKQLEEVKSMWLRVHTLHTELHQLVLDHEIEAVVNAKSKDEQFYKVVRDCVTLAEVGDYLDCNMLPGSDATLLGLEKDDIDRFHPHKKHLPTIQRQLIPEIEDRLNKRCEALSQYYNSTKVDDDSDVQYTFTEAMKIPEELRAMKKQLVEWNTQLKQEEMKKIRHAMTYNKTLHEIGDVLNNLLTRHRLGAQRESDEISCRWLGARCKAMLSKMKLLEKQLLRDTYDSKTVPALSIIRQHLDKAIDKKKSEMTTVNHSLAAFEACGLGFDDLVQNYTYIRDQIETKNWAIKELKSTYDGDDDDDDDDMAKTLHS